MANVIYAPEDGPTRDYYGWDPLHDADDDNSNSDHDSAMSDDAQGKISHDTRQMMDHNLPVPIMTVSMRTSWDWWTHSMMCSNDWGTQSHSTLWPRELGQLRRST
jgi:hypothetical protein